MGKTMSEGHASFIGFGEMPYCMRCACFLGKITCIHSRRAKRFIVNGYCMSDQMCISLIRTVSEGKLHRTS